MAVRLWGVRLLCVALGAVLILSPVKSLAALTVLVAAGLIVTAALELAHAASTPAARATRMTASVATGLLVLIWPAATVFVISVLVGALMVSSAISASASSAEPAWLRASPVRAAVVALVVTGALVSVSELMHAADPRPDGFYTPPAVVPAAPGVLLRSEPFHRTAGTHAWRILYTTTRDDRTAAVASALVVAADQPPAGSRPVIAWAHGATGIVRECAPSLLDDSLTAVPGLDQVLAQGWVVVATDYIGLGTSGPHPFLIGQGGARAVLDSVRAARQLSALTLGGQTLVWGYSQGGNAALWTGILAPTYAPDVGVTGVAALAPGSNLTVLANNWGRGQGGVINAAYLIQSYSDTYPDVDFGTYVRPTAAVQVHELASRCLSDSRIYLSGISLLLLRQPIWAKDPATGPVGARLRENTPTGPIPVSVLIAQGEADPAVTPSAQADYVNQRCVGGGRVDYRTYPNRDHLSLVAAGSPVISELLQWSQDRLDGRPDRSTC